MEAMKAKAKEMAQEALNKLDGEAGETMPAPLKLFLCCNGGSAVKTMNCMSCALPADMKESAASMYEKYEDLQKKIDE